MLYLDIVTIWNVYLSHLILIFMYTKKVYILSNRKGFILGVWSNLKKVHTHCSTRMFADNVDIGSYSKVSSIIKVIGLYSYDFNGLKFTISKCEVH